MWWLMVGLAAVGAPLWRAYWSWDTKRFRRHATRIDSQLWYAHAEANGIHTTLCIHFPSMILEERVEGEGAKPRSRLYHVRRLEGGVWQRAATKQSAGEAQPRDARVPDDAAWEPLEEATLEEGYQRFVADYAIAGAHQDGIPRRTRGQIKAV